MKTKEELRPALEYFVALRVAADKKGDEDKPLADTANTAIAILSWVEGADEMNFQGLLDKVAPTMAEIMNGKS